jgi:peptide/nickel transport system substrate-binding protein
MEKSLLKASGYSGERVVIISPSDVLSSDRWERHLRSAEADGHEAELAATDWASLTNRRALREPVEKGGWSIFHTWAASSIIGTPVEHLPGSQVRAWAGGWRRIEN